MQQTFPRMQMQKDNVIITEKHIRNPKDFKDTETSMIFRFIETVIESHLWKHSEAKREMLEFVVSRPVAGRIYDARSNVVSTDFKTSKITDFKATIGKDLDYKALNKFYLQLVKKYNIPKQLSTERGNNRIQSLRKYIDLNFPVSCYLDIGCFDGKITESLGKYFGLSNLQIYGVDVESSVDAGIIFSVYDGKTLPYSDNSFDLITCMMVLHHIPKENLAKLCHEINRVMKPNGVLILREHDVEEKKKEGKTEVLDLMHNFYDYVWTDKPKETQWETNYKSNVEWTNLLEQNGFKLRSPPAIYHGDRNPFFTYYASYQKLGIDDTKHKLYRILPSEMKREKYHSRTKEIKNVIHWGQRKLLLSEIEFLTLYCKIFDSKVHVAEKSTESLGTQSRQAMLPIYVVYAGSAPGTHILYLAKLFPTIHFELYDPREFSPKLKQCDRIKTHVQYFTDETANEWKSEEHKDKTILFISDIRTGDTESMSSEEVEKRVKIDNQWQMGWYYIMKPELSMFKFRLPYDSDGTTEYLDGDIYLQAYAPATSTETRLIVGKDAKLKTYDDRKFEEQLFYFNNYERILNYDNALCDISPRKKYGLKNNYDGTSEVHILEQYIAYCCSNGSNKDPKNVYRNHIYISNGIDKKDRLLEMINEISQELSHYRTLYSEQPVKDHKKNVMFQLQKDGYIPKNAELNQKTFDIYIIPRYDYFDQKGYFIE